MTNRCFPFFLVLLVVGSSDRALAAGRPTLSVPFLPQTEALCGGAAAAMVFRYWGDAHADVQQFAPLVDREADGILDRTLIDAIRDRGWTAARLDGSFASLQEQLNAGRPVILLLEDRPGRYHYVVAVGGDDREAIVHDPTWGPSRALSREALSKIWAPTGFWMLVVTPGAATARPDTSRPPESPPGPPSARAPLAAPAAGPTALDTACDRLLIVALDEIAARGIEAADAALGGVRAQCPKSGAVARELAGVRFGQSRWQEAEVLAREALSRSTSDSYAWDVLGSSLFLQNDAPGALAAWNRIGKPTLDLVRIDGLTRARYALVARVLGLTPNTLLPPRAFGLASRRLDELPDRVASRLTLEPAADGYATVTARIQETSRVPKGLPAWGLTATQTLVDREIVANIAGGLGQGEVWTARWRWWEHRPRIAASFAAPVAGRFGGVWRVAAAWDAQTYAVGDLNLAVREERNSGSVSVRNWLTPNLRYEIRGGIDAWSGRKAVPAGGTIEQRLFRDRLALAGTVDRWFGLGTSGSFAAGSADARLRSSVDPVGVVVVAGAHLEMASTAAPLGLWPGAGEGRARPGLLRAHRLLHGGVLDGPVFGRRVGYSNMEIQRWFQTRTAPIAVALFTDLAHASERLRSAGDPFQVDAGVGLRARPPGFDGTLRLDYARGLRDGAQTVTVGWTLGR